MTIDYIPIKTLLFLNILLLILKIALFMMAWILLCKNHKFVYPSFEFYIDNIDLDETCDSLYTSNITHSF